MADRKKVNYFLLAFVGLILPLCILLAACGANSITVTLYDGNTIVRESSAKIDSTYNFGGATKTGYTFLGWYSEIGRAHV